MGRLGMLAPFPFSHLLDLSSLASYVQVLPLPLSPVPDLALVISQLDYRYLPSYKPCLLYLSFPIHLRLSCSDYLQFLVIQFLILISLKISQQFPILIFIKVTFLFLVFSSSRAQICCLFILTNWSIQVGILTDPTENMYFEK